MSGGKSLDELRREIDAIDGALRDLLVRRAETAGAIARTKPRRDGRIPLALAMRPAREAEIMRRLVAGHSGAPPAATMIHVMREILAASLAAQVPFQLHVFAGAPEYGELARLAFGAAMPLTRHESVSRVVHAVADDTDAIGVVPLPECGGETWWTRLAPAGASGPRVIARLPFVVDEKTSCAAAFAIAAIEQEATGDDATLLRAEVGQTLSRTKILAQLKDAGIVASAIAGGGSEGREFAPVLMEAEGFVTANDPRLVAFCAQVGVDASCIFPVGGYANPVRVRAKEDLQ